MQRRRPELPVRRARVAVWVLVALPLTAVAAVALLGWPPSGGQPATVPAGAPAANSGAGEAPPPDAAGLRSAVEGAGAEPFSPDPGATLREDLVPMFRLIEDKRTGPARVRVRKHLDVNPGDGQAEFLFGLSYHREKRYGLARPWFDRAVEHAPSFHPAWYFRGWCLYYLGETDLARASFETHLRAKPDEGDSQFALGLIALDEDRLDDADARFRRAIELQRDDPSRVRERAKAHARLADVLVRRGAYAEAKLELIQATTLFPDHYEAFYKLYRVHMRLGETELAEAAQQQFFAARERVRPGTSFPE